jgi:hypothetical protein
MPCQYQKVNGSDLLPTERAQRMDEREVRFRDLTKPIVQPSSQTGRSRHERHQKLPLTARQTFVRWTAVQFFSFRSFASETVQSFMAALFPRLKTSGKKTLPKGLIESARSLESQLFPKNPKKFLIPKIVYNPSEIVNERPF